MRFIVDLDQERGIAAREGRTPNTHRVAIRKTNAVNLAAITGYLEGKMQFGNAVLEAISKNILCKQSFVANCHKTFWIISSVRHPQRLISL